MQSENRVGSGKGGATSGNGSSTEKLLSASTLIGDDVYGPGEEKVGTIKDFMLDLHSGDVSYAVVSAGGLLGIGGKLFAVPLGALTLDRAKKRFVLGVNAERMKKAPGFDKDKWPDMTDAAWVKSIHAYYGSQVDTKEPVAKRA